MSVFFFFLFVYCSIPCDTDLPLRQVHHDESYGKVWFNMNIYTWIYTSIQAVD